MNNTEHKHMRNQGYTVAVTTVKGRVICTNVVRTPFVDRESRTVTVGQYSTGEYVVFSLENVISIEVAPTPPVEEVYYGQ